MTLPQLSKGHVRSESGLGADLDTEIDDGLDVRGQDVAIEAVTWRLSAFATTTVVEPDASLAPAGGDPEPIGHRPMTFSRAEPAVEAPVYRRSDLGAGALFHGPAVVEERETTSVIRPGWSVEVAADGSLIASRIVPGTLRDPASTEETS